MAVVGNIMVRVGADVNKLQRGMKNAQKTMQKAGANLKATAKTISLAVAASLTVVGASAIKMANQYEANLQQVNRIFGENANSMDEWAKNNASNFNMSRSEAIKYASIYGNLISNITQDTEENAKHTQELLKKSAIVASATGRSIDRKSVV
jgi:maleate cis-trans isomerase